MPYKKSSGRFEYARSIGHVPIVQNEMVRDRLRNFRTYSSQADYPIGSDLIIPADMLGLASQNVRWVASFDGSPQEVATDESYPSTRIGYIQVAGVLVQLDHMLQQGQMELVDPAVIRNAIEVSLHSMVLPCSNVCRMDMPTVRDSWRAEVFEIFRDYTVEGTSLLQVYMHLVKYGENRTDGNKVLLSRCSVSPRCSGRDIGVPMEGCACPSCGEWLFPTDALRLHEEVSEENENATALGRFMSVIEHMTLMSYLYYLSQRQPRVLGTVGFILDGPLAVFGPQSWFHTAILGFLKDMRENLVRQHLRMPVIVGIEKGGLFAEHAQAIADRIPRRHLMMLPDEYIYQHIVTFRSSSNTSFGRDTYYGQKFIYKTSQGKLLTVTIPKISGATVDPYHARHYSFLPDTLGLLDRVGTSLYENAVIPIALAHSFASIPLRTGSKVLTLLSRELLGQNGIAA